MMHGRNPCASKRLALLSIPDFLVARVETFTGRAGASANIQGCKPKTVFG